MKHNEAVEMLKSAFHGNAGKSIWADLGSGDGTFTLALADMLAAGSTIYAMDMDQFALTRIPDYQKEVEIKTVKGNFVTDEFPLSSFDGILMANSLHYVKDKKVFIGKLKATLREKASLLLVEYDTDTANSWAPYPLSFESLKRLFKDTGFHSVTKLHERPSIYQRSNMYSALIL